MGIQKRWKSGQEKEFNLAGIWEGEGGIQMVRNFKKMERKEANQKEEQEQSWKVQDLCRFTPSAICMWRTMIRVWEFIGAICGGLSCQGKK